MNEKIIAECLRKVRNNENQLPKYELFLGQNTFKTDELGDKYKVNIHMLKLNSSNYNVIYCSQKILTSLKVNDSCLNLKVKS